MSKSVLIIEDDHNIADLLRLYLEKEGYEVAIASDGGKGVEAFRQMHPSLVLLDLMLPVLNGWGVCRTIRAESDTPIIPIYTYEMDNTLKKAKEAYEAGVYVNPVLPPATAPNECLLRTSYMATHTEPLLDEAVEILAKVLKT